MALETIDNLTCLGETFKKTKLLGTGTFGKVFLMTSPSGQTIAAKTILIQDKTKAGEVEKETQVMAKLHHPHIVQFLGAKSFSEGSFTILMECVGGDLQMALDFMDDDEKRIVFEQLLLAVGYMHAQGFAHCDLKPENVLVKNTANVKICDFGGATEIQLDASGCELPQAAIVGSRSYDSPLKILRQPSKASKDDIWSLGLILFWLFVEDLPWRVAIQEEDEHFHLWTKGVEPPAFECLENEVVEVLYWTLCIDENVRPTAKDLKELAYCKSRVVLPPPPGLASSPMAPPPGFEQLNPKNLF
ncbi:hypothetical protein L596_019923 [Steinernema carpocapsae]|uniref:Protein kinase domain-containing protein n=1 Tax=Steinernema carpocapsae TaxID=34508 RepID=A0A4U5MRZ8_STECR|nr:hypothetical protein L596_019923 [Steinernema carpocapsae]